jgi:3-dehydroquinate synthase
VTGAAAAVVIDAPVAASGSTGGYEVVIEPGSFIRLGEVCRERAPAHRYAIISDSRVGELYGQRALDSMGAAGCPAELFSFPAGEWNKTTGEWASLSQALARAGFGRDSVVVALGGGVTGDLAGFVAATYLRGVPVVQVPTSLLAMVDSSVGGKTGVDTEVGKNLIGAFHHPAHVLADPELLSTLPAYQVPAGLAEAIKAAAVADAALFEWVLGHAELLLEREPEALTELIGRAVRLKAEIVARDPEERGERAILNFGHTIGHALELLFGYGLLHGEAVACGMRVEAHLGEGLGLTAEGTTARLEAALEACGLDNRAEEEKRPDEIWRVASRDKKARGGKIRCVFLREIGGVARGDEGEFTHPLRESVTLELLGDALRPSPGRSD